MYTCDQYFTYELKESYLGHERFVILCSFLLEIVCTDFLISQIYFLRDPKRGIVVIMSHMVHNFVLVGRKNQMKVIL